MAVTPCPCGQPRDLGAVFCSDACCDRHAFDPHSHPLVPVPSVPGKEVKVTARSRPCSGRFWCPRCGTWLTAEPCKPVAVPA